MEIRDILSKKKSSLENFSSVVVIIMQIYMHVYIFMYACMTAHYS